MLTLRDRGNVERYVLDLAVDRKNGYSAAAKHRVNVLEKIQKGLGDSAEAFVMGIINDTPPDNPEYVKAVEKLNEISPDLTGDVIKYLSE